MDQPQALDPPLPTSRWRGDVPPPITSPQSEPVFQLDGIEQVAPRRRKESAGWLSSLAIHSIILVVIAFLVAPADYGGLDAIEIYMSLTEQTEELEFASLTATDEVESEEEDGQLEQVEPATDLPEAVDLQPVASAQDILAVGAPGTGNGQGKSSEANSAGPRGSFFGIEAYGHEFVYVMDMSGSMEGRRFKRASAELVRSVGELSESQKFYVLLFSDNAVQMFGQSSSSPESIKATRENKEKLSLWLRGAYSGGGTDPRGAVRVALKMQPSAIFMLSDGEFKEKQNKSHRKLINGNADTFSIVAAAPAKTPIHAIAFEDKKSCANMQRLAEMTQGQYRFTEEVRSEEAANESMQFAMAALKRGDKATAELMLREVVVTEDQSKPQLEGRRELANILRDRAQEVLEENDLAAARSLFTELVLLDPEAKVTEQQQSEILDQILSHASAGRHLARIAQSHPDSKVVKRMFEPMAEKLLAAAQELESQGKMVAALSQMDEVVRRFPSTSSAELCRAKREGISEQVMAEAEKLRESGDVVATVRRLREIRDKFRASKIGKKAQDSLQEIALGLLAQARDANVQHDRKGSRKIHEMLREGFESDAGLGLWQKQFTRNERMAREQLREANRIEATRGIRQAEGRYRIIMRDFPNTLAARQLRAYTGTDENTPAMVVRFDQTPARTRAPLADDVDDRTFVGETAIMLDALVE